jgi:hypothetical protein
MSKVDIKTLDSLSHNDASATKLINDNFDALKKAVEDSVSRTGKTPNFMDAEFDMNSRRIINLGEPVDDTDAVSYGAYKEHIHKAVQAAEDSANSAKKSASSAAESKQYSIESRRARDLSEQYANEAKKTVENATADITQAVSDGLTDITDAVYNGKTTLEETTAAGEEALKKYNINTFFNPFVASMTYTTDDWLPTTVYAAEGYNFVKTLTYNSGYPMPSSSPYSASAFVTLSMKDAVSGNVGPYATAFLTNSDKNEAVFGLSLYVKELPTEPIVAENISWFIKEMPNGAV